MKLPFNQKSLIPGIANAPQPLAAQAAEARNILESSFGEDRSVDNTPTSRL